MMEKIVLEKMADMTLPKIAGGLTRICYELAPTARSSNHESHVRCTSIPEVEFSPQALANRRALNRSNQAPYTTKGNTAT